MAFRLLATVIVVGLTAKLFSLVLRGELVQTSGPAASSGLYWSLAAIGLMVYTLWSILTSKTSLTDTHLLQTWMWDKKLELRELAYVKLIRVPGLDWLIAPRLYCRTLMGKFAVFYSTDAMMLTEFERLRDELSAFRKQR